jgi:hypothetical protein
LPPRALRALVTLICCLVPLAAAAQSTGTIRGLVRDADGGVLPGATVTVTSAATGQTLEATTTGAGVYAFAFLPPAEYSLSIEMSGFTPFKRERVVVNVAGTSVVDATLAPAGVTEEVTVQANVSQLQVDTSTLGGVVDSTMMTAVPLSSRNFTQVLALSPGVASDVPNAGAFGRNSVNIAANGARPWENSVILDGIVADNPMSLGFDDAGDKTGVPVPSPDAIQEFRVQTGLYDAEYGRQGGAAVNVVTKSGTNRFSGSAYEFFRDDAMNANEFFRKRAGQSKPVLEQNQYGATFGGPVLRDRLFFFGAYQGTRQDNGVSSSSTRSVFIPDLGDRSAASLGRLYGGRSGLFGGTAIAADGSNINPVALAILNAKFANGEYIVPNAQTMQANGTGLSAFSVPAHYEEDQILSSIDYTHSSRQRVAFKLFFATLPSDLPFSGANLPGFGEINKKSNMNMSASHTFVLNNTSVNEARFGYSRNRMLQTPVEPLNASDLGMTAPIDGVPGAPFIGVSGLFSIGPAANNDQYTYINSYEFTDTLSMTRGRHALRAGGSVNMVMVDRYDAYLTRGNINFSSFPDFLLGLSAAANGTAQSNLSSSSVSNGLAIREPRFMNLAGFVQDDFRVTDRLAVNLGLRWQYNSQPWDAQGRLGGFDRRLVTPFTTPPAGGSFVGFTLPSEASLGGQSLPPGVVQLPYNRIVDNENWKGFSPRLGATWKPFSKAENVVVRGGYGIFYSAVAGTVTEQAFFDPWYVLLSGGGANVPGASFQSPYPAVPQVQDFPVYLPYTYPPTRSIYILDPQIEQPRTQQWSVNVQGQIQKWLIEVGYVGSKGTNLYGWMYPNQAVLASPENPVNGQTTNTVQNRNLRVPYVGWSATGIQEIQSDGFGSTYHALQVSVNRRYSQGLSLRASYTFGQSRDNVNSSMGGRNQPLGGFTGDYYDRDANEGPSSFDRRHRLVVSYLWEIPGAGLKNAVARTVIGGWSLSGVTTVQTGLPFSVTDTRGGTIYGVGSYGQFADGKSASDAEKSGRTQDRLNQYFDTSIFVAPPAIGNGTGFGNVGRNVFRGPGQTNFDLALAKTATVGGLRPDAKIEFRLEAFNVFNTPQFGLPGTNASNASNFGVISTTVVAPRIVQLALKYRF